MTQHFLAFWNLENLFAPESYELREAWLARAVARDLSGWSEELFGIKIRQLSSIIVKMNGGDGPDLLGVCEVENAFVLHTLVEHVNSALPARRYSIVHADATKDRRGIDTAFIYDTNMYTIDPEAVFSHFVMRRTGTRDITQATFQTTMGNEIVALCNHWPSRSGGAHESRGYRMTAGETLAYWHQRIRDVKGKHIPIIAFGDFNDDPFDESIVIHARATRERGDVERARSAASFYNLAWNYLLQTCVDRKGKPKLLHGTMYFRGDGNMFDQILVSQGLLLNASPITVDENSARIEAFPEMVDHRVSYGPIRFGLPKGNVEVNVYRKGYSDHFPVSVVLEEKS